MLYRPNLLTVSCVDMALKNLPLYTLRLIKSAARMPYSTSDFLLNRIDIKF